MHAPNLIDLLTTDLLMPMASAVQVCDATGAQ
jgi:hypothetical protein